MDRRDNIIKYLGYNGVLLSMSEVARRYPAYQELTTLGADECYFMAGHPAVLFSKTTDFDNEYPTLTIKPNPDCHDRFIVLDYGLKTEKVYHCGASSKDAGKKVCAINAIENTALVHPIINALLKNPDKAL